MIRVIVDSIRVSLLTQHRVVVLREMESRRYLPIFIDPFVADAIASVLQGLEPQRPLTHDLLKSVFGELGATLTEIVINDLRDGTFFARISAVQAGRTIEIDSRSSDAIALAVRADIPILVADHVFQEASASDDDDAAEPSQPAQATDAPIADPPEPETPEENLSIFRDFINTLKLDDGNKDQK